MNNSKNSQCLFKYDSYVFYYFYYYACYFYSNWQEFADVV